MAEPGDQVAAFACDIEALCENTEESRSVELALDQNKQNKRYSVSAISACNSIKRGTLTQMLRLTTDKTRAHTALQVSSAPK